MSHKPAKHQRVYDKYSEIFDEKFCLENEVAYFEHGATYNRKEQILLSNLDKELRKKIHLLKNKFGGTVDKQ